MLVAMAEKRHAPFKTVLHMYDLLLISKNVSRLVTVS